MNKMGNEYFQRLYRDGTRWEEVEVYLDDVYGPPQYLIDKKDLYFGNIIQIQKNQKGKPKGINFLENWDDKAKDQWTHHVEDIIYNDLESEICGRHIFFNKPINGFYRYHSDFQIIPVPPGAPRPSQLVGYHPAILEFTYPISSNMAATSYRREKRWRELVGLLTILISGGIKGTPDSRKIWVLNEVDQKAACSFLQPGYRSEEWHQKDEIGFSHESAWKLFVQEDTGKYYHQSGIDYTRTFTLPESFEESLRRFESLAPYEKNTLLLSSYWISQSFETTSNSLAFSALFYALEGLAEPTKQMGKCEECKQPKYSKSITNSLTELFDTYGVNIEQKYLKELYGIRSKIAHGRRLMQMDEVAKYFLMTPDLWSEHFQMHELRRSVQIIAMNWLHHPNRKTIESFK